jgi:outer membrane protein
VVPLVQYRSKRLSFEGLGLSYHVLRGERLSLDLVARARFDGFDADDSRFLAGMKDRHESVDAGVAATWRLGETRAGELELEARVTADLLGRSDGMEAALELGLERWLADRRLLVRPGLAVVWQDDDLVDYYYGVRADEAAAGRPAFEGSAALDIEAGLTVLYRLTPRLGALALVRVKRLGDEIVESPIVEDREAYLALVGLSWSL